MAKRGTTLAQHMKSKNSPKTKKRLEIKFAAKEAQAKKIIFKKK